MNWKLLPGDVDVELGLRLLELRGVDEFRFDFRFEELRDVEDERKGDDQYDVLGQPKFACSRVVQSLKFKLQHYCIDILMKSAFWIDHRILPSFIKCKNPTNFILI